jgi:hypothetical protein
MQRTVTPEVSDTICFPFRWVFRIIGHCELAESGNNKLNTAYLMSLPRWLVSGFQPYRACFDPSSCSEGFMVGHVAIVRGFPQVLQFLCHFICTDRSISVCQRELAHWAHKCTAYQVEPVSPLHTYTEEDRETDVSLITTYSFRCKIYVIWSHWDKLTYTV